jgi:hypothetical protein
MCMSDSVLDCAVCQRWIISFMASGPSRRSVDGVAPYQVFAVFGYDPSQGAPLRVPSRFGIAEGLESLLAIDHFAALVIVKFLKLHGFNSLFRFGTQMLKCYLPNYFSGFNSSIKNLTKVLKQGAIFRLPTVSRLR